MMYISEYESPLGAMTLSADESGLTGLWFNGQRYSERYLGTAYEKKEIPVFTQTKKWLDAYFSGENPICDVPLSFIGSEFQKEVWEILRTIGYGETMTYGEIAKLIAVRKGLERMSAQAVGGAVGRNRLAIIVPCHRVVGADGSLTGYAGGIERKQQLLLLERSTK